MDKANAREEIENTSRNQTVSVTTQKIHEIHGRFADQWECENSNKPATDYSDYEKYER